MKYIKENLILFQVAISLFIGGTIIALNSSSYENTELNLLGGIVAALIGSVILWNSFIKKILKDKK